MLRVFVLSLFLLLFSGCSIRNYATNALADALAEGGSVYASDGDIELVGAATPFGLKTMETLLSRTPEHRGLLLALARGFTQYAYVYVEFPANELEEHDLHGAYLQRGRARNLYLRARDYGLRGLDLKYPAFSKNLKLDAERTVNGTSAETVPLLYWTAVSWAAAISLSKDDAGLIADLPVVEALIYRAMELDENYEFGAIHQFLISYEMSKPGAGRNAEARARSHFNQAVRLSGGHQAAPYIALAEAVSVARQNRREYTDLLRRALQVKTDAKPEWRLVNRVMQRRARWLLAHVDDYFSN